MVRKEQLKRGQTRGYEKILLEPVVTTEFTILELAYSRPGSLQRACAPTGPRFTGATTYKALGLTQPKRLA